MNNQAIIDEIKAKLTKDKNTDVSYLETELIVFRTLKNEEVVTALEQLLFEYLSREEKEAYDIKTHEILSVRYDDYQQCLTYINDNKLDEAEKILVQLIKTYEKIENVKTFNYYDFEQMIEYVTFCKSVQNAKKLKIKRYPEPITYYCYQLALIYLSQNKTELAEVYLEKALKFNPSSIYVRSELINVKIILNKLDEAISLGVDTLNIAYTNNQLADLYQILGICFYKKNKLPLALSLYIASDSLVSNDDKKAIIQQLQTTNHLSLKMEEIKELMNTQNISFGPSLELITSCNEFIKYLKKIKDLEDLEYLLTIMYELTNDEVYKKDLESLKTKEEK